MLAILSALVGTFMHVAAPLRAVDSAPLVTRNDCVEHEQSQRGLCRDRRSALEGLKSALSQGPRRPRRGAFSGSMHPLEGSSPGQGAAGVLVGLKGSNDNESASRIVVELPAKSAGPGGRLD